MDFDIRIITKRNYDMIATLLGLRGREAEYWLKNVFGYGTKKYPVLDVRSARMRIARARMDSHYDYNPSLNDVVVRREIRAKS